MKGVGNMESDRVQGSFFGMSFNHQMSWISAFMGLVSPAPDYMDILSVINKVPNTAMIQDTPNGLFFYDSAK